MENKQQISLKKRAVPGLLRIVITAILLIGICFPLFSKKIEGVIKNVNFKSIDTARILLKETNRYFFSAKDGTFEITVPDEYEIVHLVFQNNFYYSTTLRVKMDREIKKIEVLMIPKEHLREELTVTALSEEEKSISVPMAESVVSELEIKEKIAENLVETLQNSPGVHFIGSGGFSVTPSIRGLARRRVLLLANGTRLTSDRRAGTSASFIAPELIRRIEVVRSSSSVIYGSDAIGGVVQLFTGPELGREDYGKSSLNLNYSAINEKVSSGFTFVQKAGKFNIYTGFQAAAAGNYSAPGEEILNSGYSNYCGVFNLSYYSEQRDLLFGYLGGYSKDVGKPTRDNIPGKFTTVPREINHTVNLQFREKSIIKKGTLAFQFYLNPTRYALEKTDSGKGSRDFSETTARNFGIKINLDKTISSTLSYRVGIEQYSRTNVDIENTTRASELDPVFTSLPLQNGRRSDTGLYFTFDYSGLPGFDFFGGARYTFFSLKTEMDGAPRELQANSPSAFLGVTKKIGKSVSLFVNLGRAYRTPSLSEAFYSGLTGRRYVIANPNLKAEKSFNIDSGVKFFSSKVFLGLYLFSYRVDDMIERYRTGEDFYTHDNIDRGTIRGAEIELQLFPLQNLEIFGNYIYYRGRSGTGDTPLNDIPAPRLLLGGKLMIDKFWCELNYLHSFEKSDPGPAEVINDVYHLLDLKAGYYFSANFFLYLKASNLLNESYYANPDPDIPAGKRLDFSAGINFYF
ncbi:MAG: TonB-dependent receptor [Candidatus Aminicenantes bacterium]|nr:TonB-dependent receptor [Candidatus Aminicenantes bacterium]